MAAGSVLADSRNSFSSSPTFMVTTVYSFIFVRNQWNL